MYIIVHGQEKYASPSLRENLFGGGESTGVYKEKRKEIETKN